MGLPCEHDEMPILMSGYSFLLGLLPWKAVCPLIKGWLLSASSRPGPGCLLPFPWD